MSTDFDAIVVGSGISGGWAAKELTEAGLKVLLLERGPMIEHQVDYKTETLAPWDLPYRGYGDPAVIARDYAVQKGARGFSEWSQSHWVNDRENPYQTPAEQPFAWYRGYQLGGRSLTWGRQCYRWSDFDFEANAKDRHGTDWPIRYRDIAPWYDHVERFIGVSGSREGLPQLPDGQFQKPMELNIVEQHFKAAIEAHYRDRRLLIGRSANMTEANGDRAPCQYRNICNRGCSYGAYFSTQSSTLPAARATNNLTLLTDHVVEAVDYDPATKRATGVRVIDRASKARRSYTAKLIFLNASTINTVALLLRSRSAAFPHGLANSSGTLGHYLMDHAGNLMILAKINGFDGFSYFGNRPNSFIIPRFRNITEPKSDVLRGYSYQGFSARRNWPRGGTEAGIGADYKASLRAPGDWMLGFGAFCETLPNAANRITLEDRLVDADGLPQIRVAMAYGDNERKLAEDAAREARAMIGLIDAEVLVERSDLDTPGASIHEMGGARMSRDPRQGVLNGLSQTHDVANLFVTDGACMASTSTVNPSLTYMALTARAAHSAVSMLKDGRI
jgi:choline dehydrogenase-like flavoprotein